MPTKVKGIVLPESGEIIEITEQPVLVDVYKCNGCYALYEMEKDAKDCCREEDE